MKMNQSFHNLLPQVTAGQQNNIGHTTYNIMITDRQSPLIHLQSQKVALNIMLFKIFEKSTRYFDKFVLFAYDFRIADIQMIAVYPQQSLSHPMDFRMSSSDEFSQTLSVKQRN
jgi:hypothetical protein